MTRPHTIALHDENSRHAPLLPPRHFVRTTALATAAATLVSKPKSTLADHHKSSEPTICTFIKPLQELSCDAAAEKIAALGFHGIEATVRNKGHVLPERVEEDLPKMVEAFKKRDVKITLMATDTNEANPFNEKVLRTAASLGIPRYRMSYYKYDLGKALPPQLESFKAPLAELVALNRELGIQGIYQNHSGANYCGATLWDLYYTSCASIRKNSSQAASTSVTPSSKAANAGPNTSRSCCPTSKSSTLKDPLIKKE